jgi:hypothetical protein
MKRKKGTKAVAEEAVTRPAARLKAAATQSRAGNAAPRSSAGHSMLCPYKKKSGFTIVGIAAGKF